MQQIFIDNNQIEDNMIKVNGSDANHLVKACRIKKGEKIRVSTSAEESYLCEVEYVDNDELTLKVIDDLLTTELPCKISLYQAVPKGDRMETIIEKCTELGVSSIIPVEMKRCVVKLDDKKKAKKVDRYERIAEAAAMQSKRSCIPFIYDFMTFDEAVKESTSPDILRLVPYENKNGMEATANALKKLSDYKEVAIFIGPEGGFAPEEIEALKESEIISLGKRILRTDTAAITTVALTMLEVEKLDED